MIGVCSGVSADFRNIQVGEVVWLPGHIGVYIGDGLAVECTPSFAGGCQITAVGNIGTKAGYPTRKWTKHGKLSYVSYSAQSSQRLRLQPALRSEMWFILSAENIIRAQLQRPEMSSKQATQRLLLFPRSARTNTTSFTPITQVRLRLGRRLYNRFCDSSEEKLQGERQSALTCVLAPVRAILAQALPNGSVIAISKQSNGWGYVPACGGWVCMQYVVAV